MMPRLGYFKFVRIMSLPGEPVCGQGRARSQARARRLLDTQAIVLLVVGHSEIIVTVAAIMMCDSEAGAGQRAEQPGLGPVRWLGP
jgi:hypothetical protein